MRTKTKRYRKTYERRLARLLEEAEAERILQQKEKLSPRKPVGPPNTIVRDPRIGPQVILVAAASVLLVTVATIVRGCL